jgi:predicted transcriptional regulator
MFGLWKNRTALTRANPVLSPLGHLEENVMEIVWTRGESSVRTVTDHLSRPLAYTTVMTTLDRLYKKGLLDRRKSDRAFLYSARLSREQWDRARAGELVAGFLAGQQPGRDLLVSSFLDAIGEHDQELLGELEKKIRVERKKLLRRGQR